jgi:hypothetical protein
MALPNVLYILTWDKALKEDFVELVNGATWSSVADCKVSNVYPLALLQCVQNL